MQRPEQQIHKAVFQHLRQRGAPGIFAWHTPSGGYRRPVEAAIFKSLGAKAGIPDVLVLHQSVLFCLELKADGGKPTPIQNETLEAMHAAGAVTGVAVGLDAALRWLEDQGLLKGKAA